MEDFPAEAKMRLSDSFIEKEPTRSLELVVQVININPQKQHPILNKCPVLRDYSFLVEETRSYGGDKEALTKAVKACLDKGILADYLLRKGKRAVNMLFAEYDYDTDIAVQRQEAAEEAVEKLHEKMTAIQEEANKARQEAEIEKKKAEAAENARFLSVRKLKKMGLEDIAISEISGFSIEEINNILDDYR